MSFRICAYGPLGSGKTLSMVEKTVRFKVKFPDLPVYSNVPLSGLEYKKVDSAAILFELKEPCILLLDELWHMADSRKGMSLMNDVFNMLLLRSRKQGWRVLYTQQHWRQTDLRIRYVTDLMIEPEMTQGRYVHETLWTIEGVYLTENSFDGKPLFDLYDTNADPFTLRVDEIKECWKRYCRERGMTA